jgi:hypothetical protein
VNKLPSKTSSPELVTKVEKPGLQWAVPAELGIPEDKVRVRLDFGFQATWMTTFDGDKQSCKLVDSLQVGQTLAEDLTVSSGLLPSDALFWRNSKSGPVTAIYVPPGIRKLALQDDIRKPPIRFIVPLPGLVFLCSPARAPWVYAVKKKPTKDTDIVYKAPLANIHPDGRSCAGTNEYPLRVEDAVQSFFISFFSSTANLSGRSKKFPENIIHMWEFLNGKKKYPLDDLEPHGFILDLMRMVMD